MGTDDPTAAALAARYAAMALRARLPAGAAAELGTALVDHSDPRVRSTALSALVRAGGPVRSPRSWEIGAVDPDPSVRRRAAELVPALRSPPAADRLLALVADPDSLVAETAAWACGELVWPDADRTSVVMALDHAARSHTDALVRESAVAALGAIGDPAGLPAILAGCADRPAIRRRAVLALAPFAGPTVDAALAAALDDPDWQVRQAAEDLSNAPD